MGTATSRHAVLTGDIVDSVAMREAGAPAVGELMRGAVATAQETFPSAGISEVDVFRGDSWQLLVRDISQALAVAVVVRAWLRAQGPGKQPYWDTRVAIGIGTINRLVVDRLSESEGVAFQCSGRALDRLSEGPASGRPRMTLVTGEGDLLERAGDTVVLLLDALAKQWTPQQAAALCGSFRRWTHAKIGERFEPPITKQAVGVHLEKGAEKAVMAAVAWFQGSFQ